VVTLSCQSLLPDKSICGLSGCFPDGFWLNAVTVCMHLVSVFCCPVAQSAPFLEAPFSPSWTIYHNVTLPTEGGSVSVLRLINWTSVLSHEWRRLHNKELCALYSSPNIIRVIKSRRLRWAGHVARMGEKRCIQGSSGETWGKETTWKTHA
jgi:hypothetical protein